MQSMDDFLADQAKQLAAFRAKQSIAQLFADEGLPIPEYIGGKLYGALTVHYRNEWRNGAGRKLSDAMALFSQFECVVPFNVMNAGCTILFPYSEMGEKLKSQGYAIDSGRHSSDYALHLSVRYILASAGTGAGTSASLGFFAKVNGQLVKVTIDFGTGYIGSCPQLAPRQEEERLRGRLVSRSFKPSINAYPLADGTIAFASGDNGPIKTAANHEYLFVSDTWAEQCKGAECVHALEMLELLSEQMGE